MNKGALSLFWFVFFVTTQQPWGRGQWMCREKYEAICAIIYYKVYIYNKTQKQNIEKEIEIHTSWSNPEHIFH